MMMAKLVDAFTFGLMMRCAEAVMAVAVAQSMSTNNLFLILLKSVNGLYKFCLQFTGLFFL